MKNLLALALLSLPLATLAADPPAKTDSKDTKAAAASKEAQKDTKAAAASKAKASDAKGQSKADAMKGDEKPCEPVKPCAID